MTKATITRTLIRDLPPLAADADKRRIFDDRVPGFIAEQRHAGVTFYQRYTDARRRVREVKLGRLGDITVDQARRQAELLRASVAMGADPVADRAKRQAVPTLADFARDRYLPHVKERLRSAAEPESHLRKRILPALGRKALDEITPADVAALRTKLIAEGLANGTVNRHLATLRSMMNLALRWQLFEGRNPAASPGMLREQHRDRYLTAAETQALVRALDADPSQDAAAALALLILTGARKQEILRAKWEYLDRDRGLLTVPLAKSGRPRHIPLSSAAAMVIQRQAARRRPGNPHIFPGRGAGEPLKGLQRPWKRAKAVAGLAPDLRIHDLRHSLASALANQGTPLYEIGAVLGHSQLSTTTRYAHHAPQRLIDTATKAARAWNLLPPAEIKPAG